jgi:hypothetical protein
MPVLASLSTSTYRRLAVLWTGAMIVGFSLPAASLSPVEAALGYDKAIHAALFFGFAVLWMRSVCPPGAQDAAALRRCAVGMGVVGGLFAVGSEGYQHLLPIRRVADPYDALADGVGLLVGLLGYVLYARRTASAAESAS